MNDSNPYAPSHVTTPTSDKEPHPRTIPQLLVRIVVGILGAFFIAPALWVFIVIFTGQHALAELSVYPAMIVGGIAVGWASFSRLVFLRVVAWSSGGLGAGSVLEAILMGGLGVGTCITLSGIVLGITGAALGVRAHPLVAK
jgi:hypothetical protein